MQVTYKADWYKEVKKEFKGHEMFKHKCVL